MSLPPLDDWVTEIDPYTGAIEQIAEEEGNLPGLTNLFNFCKQDDYQNLLALRRIVVLGELSVQDLAVLERAVDKRDGDSLPSYVTLWHVNWAKPIVDELSKKLPLVERACLEVFRSTLSVEGADVVLFLDHLRGKQPKEFTQQDCEACYEMAERLWIDHNDKHPFISRGDAVTEARKILATCSAWVRESEMRSVPISEVRPVSIKDLEKRSRSLPQAAVVAEERDYSPISRSSRASSARSSPASEFDEEISVDLERGSPLPVPEDEITPPPAVRSREFIADIQGRLASVTFFPISQWLKEGEYAEVYSMARAWGGFDHLEVLKIGPFGRNAMAGEKALEVCSTIQAALDEMNKEENLLEQTKLSRKLIDLTQPPAIDMPVSVPPVQAKVGSGIDAELNALLQKAAQQVPARVQKAAPKAEDLSEDEEWWLQAGDLPEDENWWMGIDLREEEASGSMILSPEEKAFLDQIEKTIQALNPLRANEEGTADTYANLHTLITAWNTYCPWMGLKPFRDFDTLLTGPFGCNTASYAKVFEICTNLPLALDAIKTKAAGK